MLITWHHHDSALLDLNDNQLVQACFQPLIEAFKELRVANGDEAAFYEELTSGQQALFMFRVYFDHAIVSREELYWWSAYFYAQPRKWTALKQGIEYFDAKDTLRILTNIESLLTTKAYPRHLDSFTMTMKDLEQDSSLMTAFDDFYAEFQQSVASAIRHAAQHIRSNQNEFVQATSN
ncbi:hypothetical protein [Paenibacillus agilis]|uniref:DUF4375 domain-containing protein n=1 Tax=Paenibacillus agilis TaxID=3020863 RepID=A0A559IZC9_9BACL|nr:hypothetical protein [Paenibacillus agilis]TVX92985.1 hypothetical protein FPZ44_07890 [Paenibacillus agilis]